MSDTSRHALVSGSMILLGGGWALFLLGCSMSIAAAQIGLAISLIGTLSLTLTRSLKGPPRSLRWLGIAALLFIGWQVIAALVNPNSASSLVGIREEWLFLAVPIGAVVWAQIASQRWMLIFSASLAVGTVVCSAVGLTQVFGIELLEPIPEAFGQRAFGTFTHPLTLGNVMAQLAVLSLGFAFVAPRLNLGRNHRMLLLVVGALAAMMTVLSGSRTPMVAMVLGIIIVMVLFVPRKRLLVGLAILVAIATPPLWMHLSERTGLLEGDDGGVGTRWHIWTQSVDIAADNIWTGVGGANFPTEYQSRLSAGTDEKYHQPHAHNDWLDIAATTGLPGVLLYSVVWLAVMIPLVVHWRRSRDPRIAIALTASLVYLLLAMTETAFTDEEVRMVLMLSWSLGFGAISAPNGLKQVDSAAADV